MKFPDEDKEDKKKCYKFIFPSPAMLRSLKEEIKIVQDKISHYRLLDEKCFKDNNKQFAYSLDKKRYSTIKINKKGAKQFSFSLIKAFASTCRISLVGFGGKKKRKTTCFTFSDPNDKTKDCHFIDAVLSKFVVFREKKSTSCLVPNDDTFLQSKRFKICYVPGKKLKVCFANDLVLESYFVFNELLIRVETEANKGSFILSEMSQFL